MLSKPKIKFIRSLEQKKFRRQENAFVAEGHKCVGDLLTAGFRPKLILATNEWQCPIRLAESVEMLTVTDEELSRASLLQHPQQVLGVFEIPGNVLSPTALADISAQELVLALDSVQDPGNLGTIIRTADWFGIKTIVCSSGTADAYNPKVVQATMGSIARINIIYVDSLADSLASLPSSVPVYGALLDGNDIYSAPLTHNGIIVMGNEGNGISAPVRECLTHRILIPRYSNGEAESLNVSIATAIILSEFRRRNSAL